MNANSGYTGWSRSNRSQRAINNDRLPLTQAKKRLKELLDADGFRFTLKDCEIAIKAFGDFGEWHHTSKMFNRTPHYNVVSTYAQIVYGGIHEEEIELEDKYFNWDSYYSLQSVKETETKTPSNPIFKAFLTISENPYAGQKWCFEGVTEYARPFIVQKTGNMGNTDNLQELRKDIIERNKPLAKIA